MDNNNSNNKKSNKKNKKNKKKTSNSSVAQQESSQTAALPTPSVTTESEASDLLSNKTENLTLSVNVCNVDVDTVDNKENLLANDSVVTKTKSEELDEDNIVVVVEEVKDLQDAIALPENKVDDLVANQTVAGPVQQAIKTLTPQSQSNNFDNLQKAVDLLAKAKSLDESKQFENALKMYRQGVDMLLEELIERQGTEQSRDYLRSKCNDFMNRIDQIKLIIRIESETASANKENR